MEDAESETQLGQVIEWATRAKAAEMKAAATLPVSPAIAPFLDRPDDVYEEKIDNKDDIDVKAINKRNDYNAQRFPRAAYIEEHGTEAEQKCDICALRGKPCIVDLEMPLTGRRKLRCAYCVRSCRTCSLGAGTPGTSEKKKKQSRADALMDLSASHETPTRGMQGTPVSFVRNGPGRNGDDGSAPASPVAIQPVSGVKRKRVHEVTGEIIEEYGDAPMTDPYNKFTQPKSLNNTVASLVERVRELEALTKGQTQQLQGQAIQLQDQANELARQNRLLEGFSDYQTRSRVIVDSWQKEMTGMREAIVEAKNKFMAGS